MRSSPTSDQEATQRFFEFFTVPIRNKNTRIVHYQAIGQFLNWCERAGFSIVEDIEPIHVPAEKQRGPRFSGIQLADKDNHQQKAPVPGHRLHSRPRTLPSEMVATQVRIGIGYSKEERKRIIRCCRQVLHQESKLLGERFGGKPSGSVRIGRFPQNRRQNRAF